MCRFIFKDLAGSAEPAKPGDELDSPKQSEQMDAEMTPSEAGGIGLLSKLVFFCVVAGIVVTFLKTRQGFVEEKSLA